MSLDFDKQIEDTEFLDVFCKFYFMNGRFPGNPWSIIIPRPLLPESIANTKPIKLQYLYDQFSQTDAKGLVSLQALCALLLHFAGDNAQAKDLARLALNEYFDNLTAECLDETNGTQYSVFFVLNRLSNSIYKYLEDMNIRGVLKAQVQAQQLRGQLNNYGRDKSEEMWQKQIKDVKNYETPVLGPLPSNEEIKNTNIKTEQEFLEESLAVASENLKAARENDEKEQQKIITDISDPTPGAVVKDFFDDDDDDVDNNQFKTTANCLIELDDYDKKYL